MTRALRTSLPSLVLASLAGTLLAAPQPVVLRAAGSTTVAPLLERWSGVMERSPQPVRITVDAKGSSTAPPALLTRTAEIAAMSRPMSDEEAADFQRARGYAPTPVHVALDAIAVLVHPSNPLRRITFAQLRDIYSGAAKSWGAVGVTDPAWKDRPITRLTRDEKSGTHELFAKTALGGAAIAPGARTVESQAAMDAAVAGAPEAIGYGSVGETQHVRALELAVEASKAYVAPTLDQVTSMHYPLARFLFLYVDVKPGTPPAPALASLLKLICSVDGQQAVRAEGYLPLPLDYCRKDLLRLMVGG